MSTREPRRLPVGQDRDRGSVALELAILTPVVIAVLGLVVVAGRVAIAGASVTTIAGNAARAASLARDAGAARAAATALARADLAAADLHCSGGGDIAADTTGFPAAARGAPGQVVAVTITCQVSFADLGGIPGLPGSRTLTDRGVSPLDAHRGAAS